MSKPKFYYLPQCSTCQKVLAQIHAVNCDLQDIKLNKISAKDLDAMAKITGSYEALFSKKAIKYRTLGLHLKSVSEKEYRQLILDEYTFLKRPVLWAGNRVVAGYTKAAIDEMKMLTQS